MQAAAAAKQAAEQEGGELAAANAKLQSDLEGLSAAYTSLETHAFALEEQLKASGSAGVL